MTVTLLLVSAGRRAAVTVSGEEHVAGCQGGEEGGQAPQRRKRREPAPWPGMLLHQDGSDHEWVPGRHWDYEEDGLDGCLPSSTAHT